MQRNSEKQDMNTPLSNSLPPKKVKTGVPLRMVVAALALVLLSVGGVVAYYLSTRTQEIRQQADVAYNACNMCGSLTGAAHVNCITVNNCSADNNPNNPIPCTNAKLNDCVSSGYSGCNNNTCIGAPAHCDNNNSCPSGQTCQNSQCVNIAVKGIGSPCTDDQNHACVGGHYCVDGTIIATGCSPPGAPGDCSHADIAKCGEAHSCCQAGGVVSCGAAADAACAGGAPPITNTCTTNGGECKSACDSATEVPVSGGDCTGSSSGPACCKRSTPLTCYGTQGECASFYHSACTKDASSECWYLASIPTCHMSSPNDTQGNCSSFYHAACAKSGTDGCWYLAASPTAPPTCTKGYPSDTQGNCVSVYHNSCVQGTDGCWSVGTAPPPCSSRDLSTCTPANGCTYCAHSGTCVNAGASCSPSCDYVCVSKITAGYVGVAGSCSPGLFCAKAVAPPSGCATGTSYCDKTGTCLPAGTPCTSGTCNFAGQSCSSNSPCCNGLACQGVVGSQKCQDPGTGVCPGGTCGGNQGWIAFSCDHLTNSQCLSNDSTHNSYADAVGNAGSCGQVDEVCNGGSNNRNLCGGFSIFSSGCGSPSSSPNPSTPPASPGASPSTPPASLVCVDITASKAAPVVGDSVTFTCGTVAGANHYEFRVKSPDGTISTLGLSAVKNVSAAISITQSGQYSAQCRICTGISSSTCQSYESF